MITQQDINDWCGEEAEAYRAWAVTHKDGVDLQGKPYTFAAWQAGVRWAIETFEVTNAND